MHAKQDIASPTSESSAPRSCVDVLERILNYVAMPLRDADSSNARHILKGIYRVFVASRTNVFLVRRMHSSGQADATTARTVLNGTGVGAVMLQSKCLVGR